MKLYEDKISQIIQDTCYKTGFLLIEYIVRHINKKMYIEVFIDNEKGITLEDCSTLSHKLKAEIDNEEEYANLDYKLEVSSPGTQRSLKYIEQYSKHINRKFEIQYNNNEEIIKYKGKLLQVSGDNLTFEIDKEIFVINIKDIKTAKVLISI
ncbi:MAG: hypothetical protein JXA68_12355 [Ignavibacteriales bacterium]|nr:hypothetical protein [Ignavibacteriales bacterium]